MALPPMLNHALESLIHGIEHYMQGTPTDLKFALIHMDHAVELVLKERAVRLGFSLFEKQGRSISFTQALHHVRDKVHLSECNRLEEIHDTRNFIQHRGVNPDRNTAEFHIESAYGFLKRFLPELGVDLADYLSGAAMEFMEGSRFTPPDFKYLPSATMSYGVPPAQAVVEAYTILERYARAWQEKNPELADLSTTVSTLARENGHEDSKVSSLLCSITELRNRVMHSDYSPTKSEVGNLLDNVNTLIMMMGVRKRDLPACTARKSC